MEHLELGLLLMAVGMLTVYAILLSVIGLGKGLIALVNKYLPAEAAPAGRPAVKAPADGRLPESTAAAIVAAVGVLTAGRGKVVKIEKLSGETE
jgi:oxaloacetate decarboxylase gamma subunit